jgi:hypothetical protein
LVGNLLARYGGHKLDAGCNGHTAAVVVRMIAAIAHKHNPRLPLTIQSLKIPQKKEGE